MKEGAPLVIRQHPPYAPGRGLASLEVTLMETKFSKTPGRKGPAFSFSFGEAKISDPECQLNYPGQKDA